MRISDWSSDVCSSDLDGLAIRISGDLVEQDKGFFYNPDNDVYFDQQKGHGLRGPIRLTRGPVDAIITAETQRLTTPTIHYQISIPSGPPGFPGGYTQEIGTATKRDNV